MLKLDTRGRVYRWVGFILALSLLVAVPDAGAQGDFDDDGDPIYGEHHLHSGFWPDPVTVFLFSYADIPIDEAVDETIGECTGFVMSRPNFSLNWTSPSAMLRFYFDSRADTLLLIHAPDGNWLCNDNSFESHNPTITVLRPEPGVYDIWVGSQRPGKLVGGQLCITELVGQHP